MKDPTNPLLLITDTTIPFVGDEPLGDTTVRITIKRTDPTPEGAKPPELVQAQQRLPEASLPVVTVEGLHYFPEAPIGKQFRRMTMEEEIDMRFDALML